MTQAEAMQWFEYRFARGSLNVARRIEQTLAELKLIAVRYMGDKNSKLLDFMPHEQPIFEEEKPASFEDVFAFLKGQSPTEE